LVINRLNNGLPPEVAKEVAASGLELVVTIPTDAAVTELDAAGKPITQLSSDSPARQAIVELIQKLGIA
jgi:CO dehydrogenase maturation factor